MKTYADANALIRLYLDFDGSGQARDLLTAPKVRRHWPLPVPPLLLFEVVNGLQRLVFESRTGGQCATASVRTTSFMWSRHEP